MKFSRIPVLTTALVLAFSIGPAAAESEKELDKMAADYNATVEDEGEQVVCELISVVGSRIKQKSCRTVRQIKQDEDEARRFMSRHKSVTTQGQ